MSARSKESPGISWPRVQRAGAWALAVLPPLLLAMRCVTDPEVPFVRDPGAWMTPALPVSAELQQWGRGTVPEAHFTHRFRWRADAPAPELRIRALRRFEATLNGQAVASGDGDAWRTETRVALATQVQPGSNTLEVRVSNAHGPPLLSARVIGAEPTPPGDASGDAGWTVTLDGAPRRVARPDDTRVNPHALAVETPLEAVGDRRKGLALLFAAGAGGLLAFRRLGVSAAAAPWGLLAAAAIGWLALFATRVSRIPASIGFDARHHLAYVEWLRAKGTVPMATDGWSTFHPPLFYLASLPAGDVQALQKLLPWLAGLGAAALCLPLARRLLPHDPRGVALATLFAALLPMNFYSSAYFSNESLHTLLATASVLVTVALLLAERSRFGAAVGLGGVLGLAALTKFTALLVVPVALFFLVVKWMAVERAGVRRTAALLGAVLAPLVGLAGWFYLRNWLAYGDPLMANWGRMPGPGHTWWQQPGFHSPGYYLGFGEALVHPYLAGFHSFWDSVYSTFWGDGFVAGRVRASDRHDFWSYEWMSAGYLLALPATALLGLGAALAVRTALGDADPRRRAAFSFLATCVWGIGLGFLFLTARLPFFAQAKATYALVLLGPLATFFALGASAADGWLARRGGTPARAVFWGWLVAWAGTMYLGFAG